MSLTAFEQWIVDHHVAVAMTEPPTNWNPKKEFFYTVGNGMHYRVQLVDVPEEFRLPRSPRRRFGRSNTGGK